MKKTFFSLKIILITLINLILIGTILFFLFEKPIFLKLDNLKINNIIKDSILIESDAVFQNNNFYSIKGNRISIETYYQDVIIAKSNIKTLNLKGNQNSITTNSIYMSTKSLSEKWNDFLDKDSLEFKGLVNGYFGPFNLHYQSEFLFLIPSKKIIQNFINQAFKKQSFKIENFRLEKLGLKQWLWKFDIQIKNNNSFDLTISEIDVNVYAEKASTKKLSAWKYDDSGIVLTNGENKIIKGQLKTTFGGTLDTFLSKIKNPNLFFYVKSNIKIIINNQSFKIPYNLKIKVDPISRKITIVK